MASRLDLVGTVRITTGPTDRALAATSQQFVKLAQNANTTSSRLKAQASVMNTVAAANDKAAASALKVARAEAIAAEATAKADAIRRTSLASAASTRATGKGRLIVAESQAQLAANRAITETVKQEIAVQDAAGRAAVRKSQIAANAARTQIAEQRLVLQQQRMAASAAREAAAASTQSLGTTRGAFSAVGSAATHFGLVTGVAFLGVVANAVIMEREFANVVRTSDILDRNLSKMAQNRAINSLRLQFDALAQELPISYKELTEIGAAANQLGISSTNLASFTKTVAQFSAVTGVSVDTASTAFGRLDSLIVNSGGRINGVNHNYQGLADAINKVGVNSVATDQQIINVSSQIAGVASAAGLGYKEIIGFSGALASVAVSPYLARGLTTRLFTDIGNAVADGGSELQKFAATAGMSAEEFANAWRNNPQKALENLFDGIRGSGGNAVNVLRSLGVTSVLDQPAIIRLANAADKFGKSADGAARSGGILRQTFHDANTAAGENARQYEVIANTVQARLQVAFNRVQVALRNIGASNLGPLGEAISGISDNILKLSQNLDKPVKLLGSIQLPFTNGELTGFAIGVVGLASAFTLLVGATAKVGGAILAVKQGLIGVGTFFQRNAAATAESTVATNAQVGANERLAASFNNLGATRGLAGLTPTLTRINAGLDTTATNVGKITASTSMFARSGGNIFTRAFGGLSQGVDRTLFKMQNLSNSSSGVVRALAPVGTVGAAAFTKAQAAASRLGGALRGVGSTLSSFVGGPLGVAGLLGAGALLGLNQLVADMHKLGTSAGDVAQNMIAAKNATSLLANVRVSAAGDAVAAIFDKSTQAFMTSTASFKASLEGLGSGGFLEDFGAKFRSMFLMGGELDKGFNYTTMGLDKINEGFKHLADSGNVDAAVKGIQNLFKGQSTAAVTNGLAHMSDVTSVLTQRLNENGLTAGKNNENLIKLAKGTLVLKGAQGAAAAQAEAVNKAFHGNAAAATEYIDAVKTAGDASVDLNRAFAAVDKKSKNPFGDFVKSAKENFQAFVDQQKNALILAQRTGLSLTELSKLSPDILAGAVKAGRKGAKQLTELMSLKDAKDAFVTATAQIGENPALLEAFGRLGAGAQQKIANALRDGASIPDAFRAAGQKGVDAFNSTVGKGQKIKLQVDDSALSKSLQNISVAKAKELNIKIGGDAAPAIRAGASAAEIISNLKATIIADANTIGAQRKGETAAQYIDRLKSTIQVLGDSAPAQAKGESAAHYIGTLQARMLIDADPTRASEKAGTVQGQINKLNATFHVDADPAPARAKGESAAEYVARLRAKLAIDADASLARIKGQSAADQISQMQGILKILGEDAPAKAKGESTKDYISRLRAMIHVFADASPAQKAAARAAATIRDLKSAFTILGNPAPARHSGELAAAYISRLKAIMLATANVLPARAKGESAASYISRLKGTITALGNNVPARRKGEAAAAYINRLKGTITADGNAALARRKGESARAYINRLRGIISVLANTRAAEAAINHTARDRTSTIRVNEQIHTTRLGPTRVATGGYISGPGSGTSDSIPARLSNGEYVIRAAMVKRYRSLLDNINYNGVAKFAQGGAVQFPSGGRITGGSAAYEGTSVQIESTSRSRNHASVVAVTELSAYDRHLLMQIRDSVGIEIGNDTIGGATHNSNSRSARRGNG